MPLSTSSSSQQTAQSEQEQYFPPQGCPAMIRAVRIATTCLLASLALTLAAAEVAARYIYPRLSHIEKRIVGDELAVASLAAGSQHDQPSVLLAGNSLLLHALDYPEIQKNLDPNVKAVRYVIENTDYLDWYYGLHRLFAEGVRPTKVLLCLNLGQMLSHGVLSSSPRQLFLASDLLAVSRDAGLDTTQTSNLVFSHFSALYSAREGIRNYLMNVADPPYARELHRLARQPPKLPAEEDMLRESRARLRQIDKLCRENGAQFVLVVPPLMTDINDLLLKAGSLEGVEVVAPIASHALGPEFYLDAFHLNEKGATVFTEALTRDIRTRFGLH